jgi:hypothetical protein
MTRNSDRGNGFKQTVKSFHLQHTFADRSQPFLTIRALVDGQPALVAQAIDLPIYYAKGLLLMENYSFIIIVDILHHFQPGA